MKLNYNVTGAQRKSLVAAISQILNAPTKYLGMPTAAYEVGGYIIDKNGTLTGPDSLDLEDTLHQQGFDALAEGREYDEPETYESGLGGMGATDLDYGEAQHYPGRYANSNAPITEAMQKKLDEYAATLSDDAPTTITIELPATNVKEDILRALIESKATLIKAVLGGDRIGELPIEFYDGKVAFNWLRFGADGDTVKAWSTFLAAAVKFSKTAKRITAKDTAVENEKFAFRTFMVKIGMNGIEDKWARKRLLQNLTGDSAFSTPESKAKWLAKHGKKTENMEGTNDVE